MHSVYLCRTIKFLNPFTMNPITGIQPKHEKALIDALNHLLADYHVYYQNLRGFHWNITGPGFFELHAHFEQLYTAAQLTIDELAERVLTLGGRPMHTMSAYLGNARIEEAPDHVTAEATVKAALQNIGRLLEREREIVLLASEADDEGTSDLLTPLIAAQEKQAWMLNAYLGNK